MNAAGQANRWIKSREKARISENPTMCAMDGHLRGGGGARKELKVQAS